tara:strand:- start:3169 stop:4164 length:996 start_codon:yes stop_codon:yes gene_type:complete
VSPQKKKILLFSLFLDAIIVALVLFYFLAIPHGKIEELKDGFVQVVVVDGKAQYTQVQTKPKNWVGIKKISKIAQQAIVISEDWAFYEHEGVDWAQVQKSIEDSIKDGKKPRGASTITQQLAKNLFLSPEYSFVRKAREAVIAHTMDRKLSKDKILEVYLNIVEFGPGIYGIDAAARHYFGKTAAQLNAKEAAFLAMLLPSPTRYAQSFKDKELSPFAKETISSILEKLRMAKFLSKEEAEAAKQDFFDWEKKPESDSQISDEQRYRDAEDGSSASPSRKKRARSGSKRDGSAVENTYRVDRELEIEDNPSFDDDALIEQVDGIDAEYTLE